MNFYDREKELEALTKILNSEEKRFTVLYGRRRIGKTSLIKKAYENRENFLYFFVEVKREEALLKELSSLFSKAIYTNWYDLFTDLFERFDHIIFDEFQNFFLVNSDILYSLQHAWDETKYNTKLTVLGSYTGLIKKIFMEEKMPLFGRVNNFINLKKFNLKSGLEMLFDFGYDTEEALEIYSLVGGVPKYLWGFKDKDNLKNKIYDLFIADFSPFKEESKNILILEFGSEHRSYFSILEAIGGGNKTLKEIEDISKIPSTSLSKYLNELVNNYEILKKENSILDRKRRNARYSINDEFFDFYFNLLGRYLSEIEFNPKSALEKIYQQLPTHIGHQFENICIQFLKEKPNYPGFLINNIGKSWGKVPYSKNLSYDIDIVAYNDDNILFGECKWTNKKMGIKDLETLKLRSNYVNFENKQTKYIFFSKSGFTPELLKFQTDDLFLLTPDKMVSELFKD
ncbi:ATPase [Petrotoga mobilis SJ95]|uniref:ATPase n=1 Tax=Petrotoga mobilis (strain DSM 10674 / SJ95) TaxID=403833 RepID=A9BHT4_PETMO|nr:ATP-binding protein [Petrotoga mobilis]ABX32049.1 ATPase [Petrotoga mobilis SJ95]